MLVYGCSCVGGGESGGGKGCDGWSFLVLLVIVVNESHLVGVSKPLTSFIHAHNKKK